MSASAHPDGSDGAAPPARDLLPTASPRETWRTLVQLARPHRWLVTGATVTLLIATAAALLVPRLLGEVVDVVNEGKATADLDRLALWILAAAIAQGIFAGWGVLLVGRTGEQLLASLREKVVDRALHVPLADIERSGSGDLVARACGDVDSVSEATREAFPEVISSVLVIGLTVVGLAALDWRLALAGLLAVPIQATGARWYLRRSGPIYAQERAAEGTRSQHLQSSVEGARTVRAFRLHDKHLNRVEQTSLDAIGLARAAARVRSWFFSRLNLAELIGLASVLIVGFLLVRNGAITVGAATAAALYFHRLFDPIGVLLFQLDTAQSAAAALARLVGVASLSAASDSPVGSTDGSAREGVSEGVGRASVDIDEVSFSYDTRSPNLVLQGVSLQVRAGERVALVGASGAGKTTLAKLVAGIHSPTGGTVRVADDSGPTGTDEPSVALVSQEVHVFTGTLADDLRLANPDATDDELLRALDVVGASSWVTALPDRLATVVSEGDHQATPAQAQQVALARLVLTDPALAILDEATAEAGSAGARQLETAADAAISGRTSIVIAHRLTQARAADRIVVLEDGRITEQGTHDELLAAQGPYATLWSAWSAGRQVGGSITQG